jgi:hypothetical protein
MKKIKSKVKMMDVILFNFIFFNLEFFFPFLFIIYSYFLKYFFLNIIQNKIFHCYIFIIIYKL